MTSKLRQNAAVMFFINRQNNSNKTISTILIFYQKKNANKSVAFLNVLSVYQAHMQTFEKGGANLRNFAKEV